MNRTEFKQVLEQAVYKYVPGAVASIARNRHMNDYRGSELSDSFTDQLTLRAWLLSFCDEAVLLHSDCRSTIASIADPLVAAAQAERERAPVKTGFSQPLVDALLVDFINAVFASRYVDFGMYTADLVKP